MNKFSEQKKQQVQTILKFLENSQISNPSHDSTKAPFFRGSPTTESFLMDNKDLPKFPDTLNRLLIDSQFYIDSLYGDYDYSPFVQDSEKQIY